MCDLEDNMMKHKWKGHLGGAHWWDQSYRCPKCYNQERLCNAEVFKKNVILKAIWRNTYMIQLQRLKW